VIKAMRKGYHFKFGKGSTTLVPADFLVDRNQNIAAIFIASDVTEHIPMDRIEQFIVAHTEQQVAVVK
jgi:hypothetical protein